MRLDRRLTDFVDKRRDALRSRPRVVVGMRKLKVVGAEHQDHQCQRRVDLDSLLQALQAVSTWLEGIFPDCPPAVETILDHAHAPVMAIQFVFQHTGPAFVKR